MTGSDFDNKFSFGRLVAGDDAENREAQKPKEDVVGLFGNASKDC